MTLVLVSCFEDFTPKIDVEPVLCVNSLIKTGEPIEVDVSRTFLYTDSNEDHSVTDAVVRIYVNGDFVSTDYVAREGDFIRIEVESRRYGRAEAEVRVPYAPSVKSISYTPKVINSVFSDDREMVGYADFDIDIALEIEDMPDVDNYFNFAYTQTEPEADNNVEYDEDGNIVWIQVPNAWFYIGSFDYDREPIFGEHIGALDAVMGGDSYGFTYFTDRQFAGKTYTLHLYFKDGSYSVDSRKWQDKLVDCGVDVLLSTISRSYYDWVNYRWQAEEGVIGGLGEAGLAQQIWGYSNVSTNAGVVAAQTTISCPVNLKEFLTDLIRK